MAKHGKKYNAAAEKIDQQKDYEPREAIALAQETSTTNFDATVELHIRLGVDPRHAAQQRRELAGLHVGDPLLSGYEVPLRHQNWWWKFL